MEQEKNQSKNKIAKLSNIEKMLQKETENNGKYR
jgi:hypothetical protein